MALMVGEWGGWGSHMLHIGCFWNLLMLPHQPWNLQTQIRGWSIRSALLSISQGDAAATAGAWATL